MGKRLKFAAFGLATLVLGAPAFAADPVDPATVVATVNGDQITIGHMIMMYDGLPDQYKQYPAEVLFDAILRQLVEQAVLAETLGTDVPARVKYGTENASRELKSGIAVKKIFGQTVTPEAVQEAYKTTYLQGDQGTEYNASHILLNDKDAADALLTQLQNGLDFAEAAKANSTGPSGPNGGSLGWFKRGAMVGPFDEAVANMQVGEIAGPVQTQFGWHLIKLNDTRPVEPPAFEDVAQELADKLGADALDKAIETLSQTAQIEKTIPEDMDRGIISDISLLEK